MLLSTFNQEDLRLPSKKKKKKKEELRLMKVVTDTFIYIYIAVATCGAQKRILILMKKSVGA
jgi:hypothetical protein